VLIGFLAIPDSRADFVKRLCVLFCAAEMVYFLMVNADATLISKVRFVTNRLADAQMEFVKQLKVEYPKH
jgi:hypothetical protein